MGFLDASGITRLCTKLKDKFAAISHNHAASDITNGTLDSARLPTVSIEKGGTGATTASAAWTALGGGSIGKKDSLAASDIPDLSGTYLPLSGGTMSGNIEMQSDTIDRDGAAPSSYQQGRSIILQDKDGERIGLLRVDRSTTNSGSIELNIGAYSENSGTEVPNLLTLKALPDGTNSVKVTDAGAWRSALGVGGAQVNTVQLGGTGNNRQSTVASMSGNGCAIVVIRNTTVDAILLVDYWSTTVAVIGNLPSTVALVKSSNSGNITVQNNTSVAIVLKVISGTFGAVTNNASALTENVTRSIPITPADIGAAATNHTHDYLPLSGGSLTGNVTETGGNFVVKSSNIDEDTTPSSETGGNRVFALVDKDDTWFGSIQARKFNDGSQGVRFQSRRAANGTAVWNFLDLIVKSDGTYKIQVPTNAQAAWRTAIDAAASSHTHSYIPTSGGTATGNITIKATNLNRDTNPSATASGKSFLLHDNDGERVGVIRTDQATDGSVTLLIGAFAEKTDGTEVPNWLNIKSNRDGTKAISVTDAAAWRTGLGVAASSHNHSGANITSGTIDVARLPYTAARGVEISGSTIRTVNGYVSAMNTTKVTKSSGNGTWTITQINIEITNTGGTVYVLAFFQISISSIALTTTNGAWYTSGSDQVLAFPWTLGTAPRVVSMGTNVDRIQDIWIKKIETDKITFRPLCAQSATVTWAGEFVILSNKSA